MRSILALGLSVVVASTALASVPPPARPPDDLPEEIGGMAGREVWSRYAEWARFEVVHQAEAYFETSLPSRWGGQGAMRLERVGPSIRFSTTYPDTISLARFERICPADGPEADCLWQFRHVGLPDLDDIDAISREHFDPAAIAAFIQARSAGNDPASAIDEAHFGLAETMRPDLAAIVTERIVTAAECPAVLEAVEVAEQLKPLNLSATADGGFDLVDVAPPSGPPPPPVGMSFRFTFPLNAYDEFQGEVEIIGGATPQMFALEARLQGGVRACLET